MMIDDVVVVIFLTTEGIKRVVGTRFGGRIHKK